MFLPWSSRSSDILNFNLWGKSVVPILTDSALNQMPTSAESAAGWWPTQCWVSDILCKQTTRDLLTSLNYFLSYRHHPSLLSSFFQFLSLSIAGNMAILKKRVVQGTLACCRRLGKCGARRPTSLNVRKLGFNSHWLSIWTWYVYLFSLFTFLSSFIVENMAILKKRVVQGTLACCRLWKA